MPHAFHIREASLAAKDDERILAFFDSQLQWLESVGSGGQWGSEPLSSDKQMQEKFRSYVRFSEAFADKSFSSDWTRTYVLEADVDAGTLAAEIALLAEPSDEHGRAKVPVAAAILSAKSPAYARSAIPEQDVEHPFLFMAYLLTDRRTGSIGTGAGSFVINYVKDVAQRLGLRRIVCDCWSGNDRKLVR